MGAAGSAACRLRLLGGASFALVCAPALAQTGAPTGSGPTTTAVPDASTHSANGDLGANAGDIVVTAQRRSEKLKDVPLSVAVFSSGELATTGVTGSRELQTAVPGLQIQATGGYVQPNIRGIGTVQSSAGSESNIAIYVDGVYMPQQTGNVFELEDLDNIQVLKGPQGSLYGRNATGGAILITTRRPSQDFQLKLNAGYGRFDDVLASAYLTGPLSDTVSASVSALYRDDNGFGRDVGRGVRLQTYREFHARGKLLFEPSSDTSILLSGDYGRVDDNSTISLKIWNGNTNFPALNPVIPPKAHDYRLSLSPQSIPKGGGGSVDISHAFGDLTLKSLTAVRGNRYYNETDNDRISEIDTRFLVTLKQRYYSEELTLSSDTSGPLRWLVGLYYINDRTTSPTFSIPNGVTRTLVTDSVVHAKALSGFFEGTYDVTSRLSLLLGGRYSTEKRTLDQVRPTGTPLTSSLSSTDSQFTPKVSLLFRANDDTNLYLTYNKGFKSGAYVLASFARPATNPETVDGYEAGLKYASGGMTFNLAGFYYDYKDIQFNSRFANGLSFLLNAAAAEIYGADAELNLPIGREFNLRVSGAYTHSEYTSFTNPPVLSPVRPDGTGGNVAVNGVDVTGNPLIRTPKFTANVTGTYTHEMEGGALGANASFYYNDGFSWLPEGRLFQKAYALVNGEISWTSDSGYRVALWSKNLTNTRYSISTSITANDAIAYARPRTYGVSASVTFR